MIESRSDLEEGFTCDTLAKLSFDCIKQKDVKFMFEVLATSPENRTIADLDSLAKIMMHVEPIKKFQNMSAIYFLCQKMTLAKYKSKDIIYEDNERADSLYIILNGKVAFYRKSTEYFDTDQVVFLNAGSCFGRFYQWKVKFIPISVEETLLALAPRNQTNKIPIQLSYEREIMVQELQNSDIFFNSQATIQEIQQASKFLTFNKVPCGSFLIREGQTPKAIFYILKGIVKEIVNSGQNIIQVKRFSQGQHCPQNLKGVYRYDLIAETPCEIIVVPKKVLRLLRNPAFECSQKEAPEMPVNLLEELSKKKQWQEYKQNYLKQLVRKPEPKRNRNLWK